MTNLAALEKRLCLVERGFLSRSTDCCCRPGGETNYHTATELERIMNVRCAVHQFRDLGSICWVPSGTPLLLEDRSLCECPPSLTRDLLAGKLGFLRQAQQEEECDKWREEFSQKAEQDFRIEQSRVAALLQKYRREKRSNHANVPS
jgi:hypothetical protein